MPSMPSSVVILTMTQKEPPIPLGGTVTQVLISFNNIFTPHAGLSR